MTPVPSSAPPAFEGAQSSKGGLLTAADVAALLAVPVSWVYAETRAGRLPHVVLGPRYRRYERAAIEAWCADLRRGPSVYRTYRPAVSGVEPEGEAHEHR